MRQRIEMPRILFDKNVPYLLKRYLLACEVKTVDDEGWGQISNGDLIDSAEKAGYQIVITCDQNIRYQQNLTDRTISLVVLGSNIWPGILPKIDQITAAVRRSSPGSFELIEIALAKAPEGRSGVKTILTPSTQTHSPDRRQSPPPASLSGAGTAFTRLISRTLN